MAIAMLLSGGVVSAVTKQYVNHADHFSVFVPSGWEQISKDAVDEYSEVMSALGEGTIYFVGWQAPGLDEWFDYPHVVLDKIEDTPPTLESLVELYVAEDVPVIEFDAVTDIRDMFVLETMFVNYGKGIAFFGSSFMDEKGTEYEFTASYFGRDTSIYLNMYSKDGFESDFPVFMDMVSSFAYEEGYGYNKSDSERAEMWAMAGDIGLFVLVIVILNILWKVIKRRFKREKEPDVHE